MFLTTSGKDKIDYLALSGGSAMVEGLESLLRDELGIHTVVINPFSAMTIADKVNPEELRKSAPQLAVAAGLALRSFTSWHI